MSHVDVVGDRVFVYLTGPGVRAYWHADDDALYGGTALNRLPDFGGARYDGER